MFDAATEILAAIEMLRATRGVKFSFVITYEERFIVLKYVVTNDNYTHKDNIILNAPASLQKACEHSNNLIEKFYGSTS